MCLCKTLCGFCWPFSLASYIKCIVLCIHQHCLAVLGIFFETIRSWVQCCLMHFCISKNFRKIAENSFENIFLSVTNRLYLTSVLLYFSLKIDVYCNFLLQTDHPDFFFQKCLMYSWIRFQWTITRLLSISSYVERSEDEHTNTHTHTHTQTILAFYIKDLHVAKHCSTP